MEGSSITPFAWVFMLVSMGSVTALTAYCYYRILIVSRKARAAERPGGSAGAPDS
jgi:hypothetical protein